MLRWEQGNAAPAPWRHPGQAEVRSAPGSASRLVSPLRFDVSHSTNACCTHGRLTLGYRCLTSSFEDAVEDFVPTALSALGWQLGACIS